MHLNFNMINKLKHAPVAHLTCPPPLASCFSSHIMRLDFLCGLLFTYVVKYCLNMEVSYEL